MRDADAVLTELVRSRGPALVGYAHLLTGGRAAAQDLVQEALVRTFGRLRSGVRPDSAEAYVRRTILHVYLDEGRRRRLFDRARPVLARPESDASDTASDVATRQDVRAALGRLGRQHRAAVVLRYVDDLTVPEVARRMGVAEGTVKRYLADALARLGSELGPLETQEETPVLPRTASARRTLEDQR
ncbi:MULTISPECIES: sigma-70 family RNA polymerase sigma factor [Cellulomonas]|uniref:sigma-70 family RNA polymerase sigma factor n=1 Tax=Cellulomonas TaxID=1707 RepID=UPI0006262DC0|nr:MULTISPECIES: sigma-70 family RNA polymerase sigma factor [Cellulomonas]